MVATTNKLVFAMLGLAAVLGCAFPTVAAARPLATVGNVTISDEDVAFRQRVAPVIAAAQATPEQSRLATLRQLIIEAAGADAAAHDLRANADLQREAEMQSRQSLLGLYDSRKVARVAISAAEIDTFIAGNPQFFGARRTWHFHEISISAKEPGRVAAMTAAMTALRSQAAVSPEQVAGLLAWTQGDGYDTTLANRWLGTEQIAASTLAQLTAMATSGRQVFSECHRETCHALLLHGSYDDRVDPQYLRAAVQRNLTAQKQEALAETVNTALLMQTPIVFHDPVLARQANKAWGRPKVITAFPSLRLLWVAQALTLFAAFAWAARQILGEPSGAAFEVKRPRWSLGMDDATIAFLRGRGVQLGLAAGVSVATFAGAIRVYTLTEFAEYTQDRVIISGFVALGVILILVPFRFSPVCRRMMEQRIGPLSTIAVLQALLLLLAG